MSPITAYLLYALFALGGAAVYLAMPRTREAPARIAGLILGLGAIVGGLILLGTRLMPASSVNPGFYIFAAIALFAAARVVTHPKPVYSAVYFVLVIVAVAALVLLEGAEFLAIALIIVYAGAILVTYAFVIMLAQQARLSLYDTRAREPLAGVVIGFAAMAAVAACTTDTSALPQIAAQPAASIVIQADVGNTLAVGRSLMTHYVVALELAGVLLLVGLVGAVALVTRKVPRDGTAEPPAPIGRIGKEVQPF